MLIGKIDKAIESSLHRPARGLGKQRRQHREEHYGEDRGVHRGVSRATAGTGVFTIPIDRSC